MLICNVHHKKLEDVREKLFELGIPDSTLRVPQFQPRVEMKIVLEDETVEETAQTILNTVKTGNFGDGKFFIVPVDATRI